MKYTITLHTSEYRGDHAADVEIALDIAADESVLGLVTRALAGHSDADFVVLRKVRAEPIGGPDGR